MTPEHHQVRELLLAVATVVAIVVVGLRLTSPDEGADDDVTPAASLAEATTTTSAPAIPVETTAQVATPFFLSHPDILRSSTAVCDAARESDAYQRFEDRIFSVFDELDIELSQEEMATATIVALGAFCEEEGERLLG